MTTMREYLTRYRAANDIPQRVLAERIGVPPSTVSDWETGRRFPSEDKYRLLASLGAIPPTFCGLCDCGGVAIHMLEYRVGFGRQKEQMPLCEECYEMEQQQRMEAMRQ